MFEKRKDRFEDYKFCLKYNEKILKSQKIIWHKAHSVFTEKGNKITLSANEDKVL